jgi:hypothetical protein
MAAPNAKYVAARRRKIKALLVEEAGGKCADCDGVFPPFMYDFDHRDPAEKSFMLSRDGNTNSIASSREEAKKCDLVCANCHRMRTHRQRCEGCIHCKNQCPGDRASM